MINLDFEAAKAARLIIQTAETIIARDKGKRSKLEGVVTKTFGILQEQGMYAASLFLWTRKKIEEDFSKAIREALCHLSYTLLGQTEDAQVCVSASNYLQFVSTSLNQHLNTMLWMKDAWELTLTYARYGAKAIAVDADVQEHVSEVLDAQSTDATSVSEDV